VSQYKFQSGNHFSPFFPTRKPVYLPKIKDAKQHNQRFHVLKWRLPPTPSLSNPVSAEPMGGNLRLRGGKGGGGATSTRAIGDEDDDDVSGPADDDDDEPPAYYDDRDDEEDAYVYDDRDHMG
jgi:hypothetical protein